MAATSSVSWSADRAWGEVSASKKTPTPRPKRFDEDDQQRGDQHNAEEGERERDQDCPRDRALADGLFLAAFLSSVTHGRTISGSRPAAC